MTDITTFPTIRNVLVSGDAILSMTAVEDLTAGQVVGFAATGVSMQVAAMDATAGEQAIGVVLYNVDQSEDDRAAVAIAPCVCICANADDTTAIDAGHWLIQNDNAVKGTVSAATTTTFGAARTERIVGIALDDIAAGSTGRVLICPQIAQGTF